MAAMDKAHKRIQQLYEAEMRGVDPGIRAALGRRLEVDARFRALTQYLEELTYAVTPGPHQLQPIEGTHLTPAVIADAAARIVAIDAQRPHTWNTTSPGLAGSVTSDSAEAAPGDVPPAPPVGRHGRPGELCGCEESKALRRKLDSSHTVMAIARGIVMAREADASAVLERNLAALRFAMIAYDE
jgi:hypothetical protein